jgi:DNA-binding FadR family transcriptional regulator
MPRPERHSAVLADLRLKIAALQRGDKLPSTRALETEYNVSYTVIRSVMLDLKREGLVHGRAGSGVYVGPPPEPEETQPDRPTREE